MSVDGERISRHLGFVFDGVCGQSLAENVWTHHVQSWLNKLAKRRLSRYTLKHIKSALSAIF